jgi:ferredoxin
MTKIFYFSGTGNSYQVAKELSMRINECELIKITYDVKNKIYEDDAIGVIFPVYYFGLPKIVEHFLNSFEIKKSSYLFIVATRGIPFAGGVRKQLINILGDKISYFRYITMGDNFNIDFWNCSSNKTKELRNIRSDVIISKIITFINNKTIKREFTLIDYLWFITERFPRYGYKTYVNKVYNSDDCFSVNNEICTQCKKCAKSCPVENVRFDKELLWMNMNCQLCLACFHCCPVNAIQYTNEHLTTIGKKQYWNY